MNDELGNRIKENYENRTRYLLPRRTYTILRLDGKAFHTYTRGLKRPFDIDLINDMNNAIVAMLPQLQGVAFAYTQSDEISILLTDFEKETTSAWFDGNLQKMCSVAASIITAEFNACRLLRQFNSYVKHCDDVNFANSAYFDCRVFTIPDRIEVINYFRWRQQDCIRNSLSMVAQSNFSHKELHGKSQSNMHDMLHAKDVNWATDYTDGEKNGRIIMKETYKVGEIERTRWVANGAWVFSKDEGKLLNTIPKYE
jgi:tRNA(His) 5'-end guanylyltransferase